jgi:hypothetical protein
MRYYTESSLSDHIKETPEGYLLCLDVPIARTGEQEYLPDEVPVEAPAGAGRVKVYRLAAEVFAPETIASFEGKPVTLNHPEEFVSPSSWRELSRGVAQNLRQGEGPASDLLLADLLITDAEAIKAVQGGLREISCGYDADYEMLAPGVGRQVNIIGNHVALVECGRCGARCRIKDACPQKCGQCRARFNDTNSSGQEGEKIMAKRGFMDWLKGKPKLRQAFDEALEEAKEQEEKKPESKEEAPAGEDDAIAALSAKVDELALMLRSLVERVAAGDDENKSDDEDPQQTGDEEEEETSDSEEENKATTGDSRKKTADADTVSRARLLSPLVRARAGDCACTVKRAALREAARDARLKKTIDACLRGTALDKADCHTLDAAFIAASELAKIGNNRKTADALLSARSARDFGNTVAPADITRINREYYDKKENK